ncbi:hypothetical protein Tco_0079344 [Tanacetum coccineum]
MGMEEVDVAGGEGRCGEGKHGLRGQEKWFDVGGVGQGVCGGLRGYRREGGWARERLGAGTEAFGRGGDNWLAGLARLLDSMAWPITYSERRRDSHFLDLSPSFAPEDASLAEYIRIGVWDVGRGWDSRKGVLGVVGWEGDGASMVLVLVVNRAMMDMVGWVRLREVARLEVGRGEEFGSLGWFAWELVGGDVNNLEASRRLLLELGPGGVMGHRLDDIRVRVGRCWVPDWSLVAGVISRLSAANLIVAGYGQEENAAAFYFAELDVNYKSFVIEERGLN